MVNRKFGKRGPWESWATLDPEGDDPLTMGEAEILAETIREGHPDLRIVIENDRASGTATIEVRGKPGQVATLTTANEVNIWERVAATPPLPGTIYA